MKDEKQERNNEKELEKNTGSSWYGNGADDHFSDSGDGFAAVDTQNLLTFVNDTMDDGSQIYYFEEVAVTLPADWKGKVAVQAQDTSVTFIIRRAKKNGRKIMGQLAGNFFLILFRKQ